MTQLPGMAFDASLRAPHAGRIRGRVQFSGKGPNCRYINRIRVNLVHEGVERPEALSAFRCAPNDSEAGARQQPLDDVLAFGVRFNVCNPQSVCGFGRFFSLPSFLEKMRPLRPHQCKHQRKRNQLSELTADANLDANRGHKFSGTHLRPRRRRGWARSAERVVVGGA